MIFALAGNQNCGKTTLFNALTGANAHVGNFPGVTVDSRTGDVKGLKKCTLVDIPGIYSMRTYSAEEKVTTDFIVNNKPDVIINIADATNIERNLYLTLQLIDLNIPMVLALNMMDEMRGNGGTVNVAAMSKMLGIPVVAIAAAKNEGVSELIKVAEQTAKNKQKPLVHDFCAPGPIHRCIHSVCHIIEDHAEHAELSRRFAAIRLIEGDNSLDERLALEDNEKELIEHNIVQMETEAETDRNAAIAEMRYAFIENLVAKTVVKGHESREHIRSQRIDKVLTNRVLAIPLFAAIMVLIFWLTFGVVGKLLSDLLAMGIDALSGVVDKALTSYGINPVVHSLIIDGIFTGVGSVLSFLPIIVTLFFFLSILEDSGYMARVAFVMDKLLRKVGLSGRSFVPMLIGFGCTVPAVMATRTLSSSRDRKMTVMLTPFMSCSAKIPIYAVFASAFFAKYQWLVMACLYFGGMTVGVIVALILKRTAFRGEAAPFIMELPNYRFPTPKNVARLLWEKAKDFLQRAFTVIFVATLIIWFLQSFDTRLNPVTDSANSLLAALGRLIAPIFEPLGFNDWRAATSLISGFTAKEAVVSTLGVLMNTTTSNLNGALTGMFTPLAAVSFLAFTLLYTPCVAAVAAIKREFDSGIKAFGVVVMQCAIAYAVALLVYQVGGLIIGV